MAKAEETHVGINVQFIAVCSCRETKSRVNLYRCCQKFLLKDAGFFFFFFLFLFFFFNCMFWEAGT